jgi:hypothetical protein
MHTRNISIVFGSLAGACAIQAAMSACSSGANGGPKKPVLTTGDARADTPTSASASGCTAWQTGLSYYQVEAPSLAALSTNDTSGIPQHQALAVSAVPSGWEPLQIEVVQFGSSMSEAGLLVYMRQCTAH